MSGGSGTYPAACVGLEAVDEFGARAGKMNSFHSIRHLTLTLSGPRRRLQDAGSIT